MHGSGGEEKLLWSKARRLERKELQEKQQLREQQEPAVHFI